MRYKIDSVRLRGGELRLEGWAFGDTKIEYKLTKEDGSPILFRLERMDRSDVEQRYGAPLMCGFTITAKFERGERAWLCMNDEKTERRSLIEIKDTGGRNTTMRSVRRRLRSLINRERFENAALYLKENGVRAFIKKVKTTFEEVGEDLGYAQWETKTAPTKDELKAQETEGESFDLPLISIVIPAYNTEKKYLSMLMDSLKAQTYKHFEVIVADGSEYLREGEDEKKKGDVEATLRLYGKEDVRFKYLDLRGNHGIAENTNMGLSAASGGYIALCDHDDELPPYALYEVAKAISEHPEGMFFYSDEDKIDFDGKELFEPHFKPDYSPELLCCVNYICHLSVIRRDLLEAAGGFDESFDGAQDHDFFLRCTEIVEKKEKEKLRLYRRYIAELAKKKGITDLGGLDLSETECREAKEVSGLSEKSIRRLMSGTFTSEGVIHIRKVCYHWRYHKGSTASDPKSKLYAFKAGARAVEKHYERLAKMGTASGADAPGGGYVGHADVSGRDFSPVPERVEDGVTYGYYHSIFAIPSEPPLISVLIPNKDHTDDLEKCIGSIYEKSEYRSLEFIIIENNSISPETFEYYKELEKKFSDCEMALRVVCWDREFNYSAINNFGASFASGDYLLLLNNDIELRAPSSISEMAAYIMREDIGIVGARLCYPDDTIQHAGVIVGLGGIAGSAFVGLPEKKNSYMHRMMSISDLSAVTAACLLTKREIYEAVGGLCEDYAVAFNDIDYCMKVRRLGYRCVYDPYAVFYHYESKSRGLEDTPEKVERFNGEIAIFASRWNEALTEGDPYYNPALTLIKADFTLKDLAKERPGEPYKLELDVERQLSVVQAEKERRKRKERLSH